MRCNRLLSIAFLFLLLSTSMACKKTPMSPSEPTPTAPVIGNFSASSGSIDLGSSTNLSWGVSNAQKVEIDQGIGEVASSGSTLVSPTATTTYTLTATNLNGSSSKSCTVSVNQPPIINSFTASPNPVILESSSLLSWNVTNGQNVSLDNGIGQVAAVSSISVTPNDTTTYTLTAMNGSLTAIQTLTLTVDWKNFICYKTATGSKYHRDGCQYLSQSKIQITLWEAVQSGLNPCSVCNPPAGR